MDLLLHDWGPIPAGALLGLLLALLISSAGFIRVVYFISTGYAFSIFAMAAASAWLYRGSLEPLLGAQLGLLALYGLRLGTFLVRRDRSPSYRKSIEQTDREAAVSLPVQVVIWVSVSVLYVLMFYPALLGLAAAAAGTATTGSPVAGITIMALGLGLEAIADHQKSRYKGEHPGRFCDVGLYRLVRCPNYLGEMLFWLGQFVAGLAAFSHWSHWAASGVGLVCIQLIMVGSTRRLELAQGERYGDREDYRDYVRSVPVLWPWLPVYSLKNARIYLG